ncbi:MAG: DEAD/DEAH box helicase family protein [Chloroflexi bacterium]|nr:DEAD/DEAH box helicase family protein [Chloroflexota bacterium]
MFNEFARYEDAFCAWRQDGYHTDFHDTYRYIDFLSDPNDDQQPREGTLWPHQWEAFLRVVYSHEVLGSKAVGKHGLLLNIVTGGGKTAVIAAVIAWLRISHGMQKFLLLCPNLIVRDRLEEDFEKGKVFKDRGLLPDWSNAHPQDFTLTTLGGDKGSGWASFLGASIILGNIHQFYQSNMSGKSNLSALMNGPDFVLFNDEAHNSPAEEYTATLQLIEKKTKLRIDTTATPDRADGKAPDSDMIYEYNVSDALAESLIATPVVYQPDIKTVELTYTDALTGVTKKVEEIDWEEVDRKGLTATQWVTDDKPMRQQMAIALKRLQEQELRAKGRYQPILFVVAVCKKDAEKAANTLTKLFKVKTLLVTEDSPDEERKKARELGRQQKTKDPYKAVVSVLMLREGWDVPEVKVILLLRKFTSKVYGQQVIGRGLRRVRTKGVSPEEPQICAVVDHPKLEHAWLWEMFNCKIRSDVTTEQMFDEDEDLPQRPDKQEIKRPEFIVDVPKEIEGQTDDGQFEVVKAEIAEPLKNWADALNSIEYSQEAVEITDQKITGVTGKELAGKKWKTLYSAPDLPPNTNGIQTEVTDDEMREAIKGGVLDLAEELCVQAGYASGFRGDVYGALMQHIRGKFLGNATLGLADRRHLDYTWKMMGQVKAKVSAVPGLVGGIIEYADK